MFAIFEIFYILYYILNFLYNEQFKIHIWVVYVPRTHINK